MSITILSYYYNQPLPPTTTAAPPLLDMSTTELVSSDPGYLEALEDVHTRFLLNLPDSELQTPDRIFFQLEQAWWFYEDWICDPLTKKCEEAGEPAPSLPRFSTLKPFCQQLFLFSPLLPNDRFADMWHQFSLYKRKISNYGCILLSEDYQKIVLCQVWNSKTYTLPAGKINQGENGVTAAARETYEETGFDPLCQYGLTAEWKQDDLSQDKITWKPLREQDALVFVEGRDGKGPAGKRRTCYVCHGVPSDFPFEPVVRKEVSKVTWYPIDALPKKSYAVTPFYLNYESGSKNTPNDMVGVLVTKRVAVKLLVGKEPPPRTLPVAASSVGPPQIERQRRTGGRTVEAR